MFPTNILNSKPSGASKFPEQGARAYFRWEIPDEAIEVNLHLNVIELLERDATWAGKRISAGVLLGSVTRGRKLTLAIEHYERATPERGASESPFGNSQMVDTMMSRWKPGKSRMTLLGFFRTCAAGKTALVASDLAAAGTNFKEATGSAEDTQGEEAERIFLLIEATGGRTFNGVVFLTRGATVAWQSESIPLNRAELAKMRAPGAPNSPQASDGAQPRAAQFAPAAERSGAGKSVAPQQAFQGTVERLEQGYEPEVKLLKKMTPLHWAIVSLAAVMILVGIYIQFTGKHLGNPVASLTTGPGDADLGLKLGASGSSWQLSWNTNAPAIINASKGRLLVADGTNQKEIDLDQASLRGGTLVYTPTGGDVVLQLEVDGEDASDSVRESVRIVGGSSSPAMIPSTVASSQPPMQVPGAVATQGQDAPALGSPRDSQGPISTPLPANLAPAAAVQPMAPIAPLPAPIVSPRPAPQTISRSNSVPIPPPHDVPLKRAPTEHASLSRTNILPVASTMAPVRQAPPAAKPVITAQNSVLLQVMAPAASVRDSPANSRKLAKPSATPQGRSSGPIVIPETTTQQASQESLTFYAVKAAPMAMAGRKTSAASSMESSVERGEAGVEDVALQPVRREDVGEPAQLIARVEPTYPQSARTLGVTGSVEVEFKIWPDGTVHNVAVKSGPKELASTAVDAVSEWRYKPARLNGVPTETTGSAVFFFKAN